MAEHWVVAMMGAPEVKPLLSNEHFSVDGTLLQAWASHASLERIDGQDDPPPPPSGPGEGFGALKEGKKLAKGDFRGIKLSNKTHRSSSDPDALLARKSNAHQKTIGADKNYDTKGFVAEMWRIGATPHVAQNTGRLGGSAIDGRTTRHEGYAQSINARRGIETVFGWIKQFDGLRQFKLRGQDNVRAAFGLHVIFGEIEPVCAHSTVDNRSDRLRRNTSAHSREALR